jgi:hypothetical protein
MALSLLFVACSGVTEIKDAASAADVISGLQLSASTEATPTGYRGVVTILNPGNGTVRFGISTFDCAVIVRFYTPDGALAWDQIRDGPFTAGGCKAIPATVTLERHQSVGLQSETCRLNRWRARYNRVPTAAR